MKSIFLLMFISFKAITAEVFFTPSTDCEEHIVQKIKEATKSIDIAVYAINNERIVNAIIEASKNKTIKIRILSDSVQAAGKSSKISFLYQQGLDIKIHSVNKIMHNKFAIFDEQTAVNGSFNWTNPASEVNAENCVFFDEKEKGVVTKYHEEFEKLWALNSYEKSKNKIEKLLNKKARVINADF